MKTAPLKPRYFKNAAELRRWFARNATAAPELVIGFMKRATGVASVIWPEAVDEALCVGWIDGVRHRIDEDRYKIRFTPRRRGSHWSNVNIRRTGVLKAAGRVKAAGLVAFAERKPSRSGRGSYEQKSAAKLSPQQAKEFRRNPAAWKYYRVVPPGYRQLVTWWITNAKREETCAKRLTILIKACSERRRLGW